MNWYPSGSNVGERILENYRRRLIELGVLKKSPDGLKKIPQKEFKRLIERMAISDAIMRYLNDLIENLTEEKIASMTSLGSYEIFKKIRNNPNKISHLIYALCQIYNMCDVYYVAKKYDSNNKHTKWFNKKIEPEDLNYYLRRIGESGSDLVLLHKVIASLNSKLKSIIDFFKENNRNSFGQLEGIYPIFLWGRGFEYLLLQRLLEVSRIFWFLSDIDVKYMEMSNKLAFVSIILSQSLRYNNLLEFSKFFISALKDISLDEKIDYSILRRFMWDRKGLIRLIYFGKIKENPNSITVEAINPLIDRWLNSLPEIDVHDLINCLNRLKRGEISGDDFSKFFYLAMEEKRSLIKADFFGLDTFVEDIINQEYNFPLLLSLREVFGVRSEILEI